MIYHLFFRFKIIVIEQIGLSSQAVMAALGHMVVPVVGQVTPLAQGGQVKK